MPDHTTLPLRTEQAFLDHHNKSVWIFHVVPDPFKPSACLYLPFQGHLRIDPRPALTAKLAQRGYTRIAEMSIKGFALLMSIDCHKLCHRTGHISVDPNGSVVMFNSASDRQTWLEGEQVRIKHEVLAIVAHVNNTFSGLASDHISRSRP